MASSSSPPPPSSDPSSSSSLSSPSSSTRWEHAIFLCFRGDDSRGGFTGHLFQALVGAGIDTFMDERLPIGRDLPEILERIEKSRISVVHFTENFASSSWCMDELVKILECKERMGQEVLPIFYKVQPSQLRELSEGSKTAEYLAKHAEELGDNSEKVLKWKLALIKFGGLKGKHFTEGDESKLVSEIVEEARRILDTKTAIKPLDQHRRLEVDDPARTLQAATTDRLEVDHPARTLPAATSTDMPNCVTTPTITARVAIIIGSVVVCLLILCIVLTFFKIKFGMSIHVSEKSKSAASPPWPSRRILVSPPCQTSS